MKIKDRILIIEDDTAMIDMLKTVFKIGEYDVFVAKKEKEAKEIFSSQCPDLIILDPEFYGGSGQRFLKYIRSISDIPIIVVSSRKQEMDKVKAFNLGADDYIVKPFGPYEFQARVKTCLRHYNNYNIKKGDESSLILADGKLKIDYSKHKVFVEDKDVGLTKNEYKIVTILARKPGKVFTYDFIMKEIWGPYLDSDNRILRVNMANIRRKMEKNPAAPEYFFTEAGVGYRIID